MARNIRSFSPIENKTITYAASTASQNVQFTTKVSLGSTFLQGSSSAFPNVIRVDNQTDKAIFVTSQAGSAPTAAVTDFEVKAGTISEIIDVGQNDFVAVIPASSATGTVYIARGLR